VASELDPNEQTARPGNAHNHRLFLDGLSAPPPPPDPAPAAKPDPGITPVDARPPAVSLSRPFSSEEEEKLAHLDSLKFFLATAPSQWSGGRPQPLPATVGSSSGWTTPPDGHTHAAHLSLNRFLLPSQEFVTCIFWNGLYHITGTDIVRALVFRFEVCPFISLSPYIFLIQTQAFGRPVQNMKKFEEGVFSDLRNLKPGYDASLEEPKVCSLCLYLFFFSFSTIHSRCSLTSSSSTSASAPRRNKRFFTGTPSHTTAFSLMPSIEISSARK